MRILYLVLLLVGLSGCLAGRISDAMRSWVGHTEAELIQSWGAPSSTYRMDDGSKVITYVYSQDDASSYVDQTGVRHYNRGSQNTRNFTINAAGIITNWRWQGY